MTFYVMRPEPFITDVYAEIAPKLPTPTIRHSELLYPMLSLFYRHWSQEPSSSFNAWATELWEKRICRISEDRLRQILIDAGIHTRVRASRKPTKRKMPDPETPPEEKSEAAGAPTPTASGKSENPVDQNKDSDSAHNLANPSLESKDDHAAESPVEGGDDEQRDVAVTHGSNPVPATGGELAAHSVGADSQPKSEKKGPGRPKGSKNGSAKKKPAAKKPVGEAPGKALVHTPPPAIGAQNPGTLRVVARTDIVLREPFSTLLPIREDTYESIKAEMRAKGFDASHPVHLWDRDGVFILDDGYTRIKAADEVGITHIPAFIHYFQDESEALGFAIRCQTDRRNITDGEMFKLVIVYDEKVKPGSTQKRQSGGTYAPKASIDAPVKLQRRRPRC